jgi:hypothetical protein
VRRGVAAAGVTRAYRLLALLPPVAVLAGVPLANRVHRYVLGMPFLLFFIVACVLLTSAVMAVIGALERRDDARGAVAPPEGRPDRGGAPR